MNYLGKWDINPMTEDGGRQRPHFIPYDINDVAKHDVPVSDIEKNLGSLRSNVPYLVYVMKATARRKELDTIEKKRRVQISF